MTKVKFEVGKEYIDNHGENYTVISRDAEFVTVEPVGAFSNYKCEVAEDANGNEEIKEIKVGRVKSTLKANFGLTEIKARVDMQEKALANAVEEVEAEKNPLKAKVEEILNRPRKSVIDWAGTFDDMKISEILSFQKDLKKFLKLGEIDLAENVFSMLKTLCRNYRAVAA